MLKEDIFKEEERLCLNVRHQVLLIKSCGELFFFEIKTEVCAYLVRLVSFNFMIFLYFLYVTVLGSVLGLWHSNLTFPFKAATD